MSGPDMAMLLIGIVFAMGLLAGICDLLAMGRDARSVEGLSRQLSELRARDLEQSQQAERDLVCLSGYPTLRQESEGCAS